MLIFAYLQVSAQEVCLPTLASPMFMANCIKSIGIGKAKAHVRSLKCVFDLSSLVLRFMSCTLQLGAVETPRIILHSVNCFTTCYISREGLGIGTSISDTSCRICVEFDEKFFIM